MNRVKNQHYVPQFCLKRFADAAGNVFVFDKEKRSVFNTDVRNVASEKYFYDLSPEFVSDRQLIEKAMCEIEEYAAPAFEYFLNYLDETQGFNINDLPLRTAIATFIVIQELRTRPFRDQYRMKYDAIIKTIESRGIEITPDWKGDATDERFAFEHAKRLLDPEYRRIAVDILVRYIWIVGRNDTDVPFYFSDSPVTRYSHVLHPFSGAGLGTEGVQIDFPLSSKYILQIYERSHFAKDLGSRAGRMVALDAEGVRWCNGMQIESSRRQIFCAEDKFDLVRECAEKHPDLFDCDRPRFKIM